MRITTGLILFLFLASCKNKSVKYSGLNDLVVGVQQIVLYDNHEFYIELGAGGLEGKYKIKNDTVFLHYYENPPLNFPNKAIIKNDYFLILNADSTKIMR
jgi:hypothetical protein